MLEGQCKAERLDSTRHYLLADKEMDEKGTSSVLVRIVASDYPLSIYVLQVAFNAYAANIERKMELPLAETNLLKLLAN